MGTTKLGILGHSEDLGSGTLNSPLRHVDTADFSLGTDRVPRVLS